MTRKPWFYRMTFIQQHQVLLQNLNGTLHEQVELLTAKFC